MPVPSSGPISLTKIYREIFYCDYIYPLATSNGVGGYGSNGQDVSGNYPTNISLSGLDTSGSIRLGGGGGDATAPYAMSEWLGYSDLVPDVLFIRAEMSEGVSENPTYRVKFQTGSNLRQVFLYAPGGVSDGNVGFTSGTFISITVDRTSPDNTVQDATQIQWYSRVDPCDTIGSTLDQTNNYTYGQSIVSANNYYSSVSVHSKYTVLIAEG